MDFDPPAEHDILRDSVRRFFEEELPEPRIREWDRSRKIPRDLWKRFAELGWMGLSVPEEFGGSSANVMTAAVLTEELAYRFPSLATDWLLVSMTARTLREYGSQDQKGRAAATARFRRLPDGIRYDRAQRRHGRSGPDDPGRAGRRRVGCPRPKALYLFR